MEYFAMIFSSTTNWVAVLMMGIINGEISADGGEGDYLQELSEHDEKDPFSSSGGWAESSVG